MITTLRIGKTDIQYSPKKAKANKYNGGNNGSDLRKAKRAMKV